MFVGAWDVCLAVEGESLGGLVEHTGKLLMQRTYQLAELVCLACRHEGARGALPWCGRAHNLFKTAWP